MSERQSSSTDIGAKSVWHERMAKMNTQKYSKIYSITQLQSRTQGYATMRPCVCGPEEEDGPNEMGEAQASTKRIDGCESARAAEPNSQPYLFFSFISLVFSHSVRVWCVRSFEYQWTVMFRRFIARIKFIFVILYLLGVQEKRAVRIPTVFVFFFSSEFWISVFIWRCQSTSSSLLVFFSSFHTLCFRCCFHYFLRSILSTWCWRIYLLFTPKINEKQPLVCSSARECVCVCVCAVAHTRRGGHAIFDFFRFCCSSRAWTFFLRLALNASRYFPLFWCCADRNIRSELCWTHQINFNYVFTTDLIDKYPRNPSHAIDTVARVCKV